MAKSRKQKIESGADKPIIKEKFIAQNVVKIEAANERQKQALSCLNADIPVVVLCGSAGTGKSLLAAYRASKLLKEKKIDKVYLVRPAVATGKSIGLLPGTLEEKLSPYFAQIVTHISSFLGKSATEYHLRSGEISYKAIEYMRGTSFEDCVVIFEEAQNFTYEEMEMVLTRIGKNCQFIFTGDEKQHDLRGGSGFSRTIDTLLDILEKRPTYLTEEEVDLMDDSLAVIEFTPDDIVRSGLVKVFVKIYNQ